MGDARDILLGNSKINLIQIPSDKPSQRVSKDTNRKPEGISREVYALTGGIAPIIPSSNLSSLKKKASTSTEKISWKWTPFSNSARNDGLKLHHWLRIINDSLPNVDYEFAKYNKKIDVIEFSKGEYDQLLQHPSWTFEETTHLFELCKFFDLRFIIIADRFSLPSLPSSSLSSLSSSSSSSNLYKERSVEELKDRYYSILQKLTVARAKEDEKENEHLLKEVYNMNYEMERKKMLHALYSQSKTQEREENEILNEAKRIKESRKNSQNGPKSITKSTSKKRKISKLTSSIPEISESELKLSVSEEDVEGEEKEEEEEEEGNFLESSSQEDKPIALLTSSTQKSRHVSAILSTPEPQTTPVGESDKMLSEMSAERGLEGEKTKSIAAMSASEMNVSESATSDTGRINAATTATSALEKVKTEIPKPFSLKKQSESLSPLGNINNIFENPKLPTVYLRGERFSSSLTAISNSIGAKMAKKMEKILEDYSIRPKPSVPTRKSCVELVELKKDIMTLVSLQRRVQLSDEEKSVFKEDNISEQSTPPISFPTVNETEKEKVIKKEGQRKGIKLADQPLSKRKKIKNSNV